MTKINSSAPLVTTPSVLHPLPAVAKTEQQSESQAAVTVSVKTSAAVRSEKVLPDTPEQLISSIFSGLNADAAKALDAAGDLSPDRVRALLR